MHYHQQSNSRIQYFQGMCHMYMYVCVNMFKCIVIAYLSAANDCPTAKCEFSFNKKRKKNKQKNKKLIF